LLTDADCRPHSELWIQSVSEQCASEKEIVLGYSPYQKEKGFLNLFIRYETLFAALQYVSYAILKNPYMGVGRNLAYRKSLFLNNKGFNGFLGVTGGDDDLFVNQHANGSNTSICVGEKALVYSVPKNMERLLSSKSKTPDGWQKVQDKTQSIAGYFLLYTHDCLAGRHSIGILNFRI
jgi:hypothetical protein